MRSGQEQSEQLCIKGPTPPHQRSEPVPPVCELTTAHVSPHRKNMANARSLCSKRHGAADRQRPVRRYRGLHLHRQERGGGGRGHLLALRGRLGQEDP